MATKEKSSGLDTRTDYIYVKWPGKTEEDFIYEYCQLGVFTYPRIPRKDNMIERKHVFNKLHGFVILEEIIKKGRMDILESTEIISNRGKKYSVEKFLDTLTNVTVK